MKKLSTILAFLFITTAVSYAESYIGSIYPMGGEIIEPGSSYAVTWDADANMSKVNITLWDGLTGTRLLIATNVSASLGKYSWQVPTGLLGNRFRVRVQSTERNGNYEMSESFFSIKKTVPEKKIDDSKIKSLAERIGLRVSPNPFSTKSDIHFVLPTQGTVDVLIVNGLNTSVAHLINGGVMQAGEHTLSFDGTILPSGTYTCVIRYNNESTTMLLNHVK